LSGTNSDSGGEVGGLGAACTTTGAAAEATTVDFSALSKTSRRVMVGSSVFIGLDASIGFLACEWLQ
jgi:hypothetical protein